MSSEELKPPGKPGEIQSAKTLNEVKVKVKESTGDACSHSCVGKDLELQDKEVSISSPGERVSSKDPVEGPKEGFGGPVSTHERGCRSCSTPLRLRRLPASFWQEPNVPRDLQRTSVACKACHGSFRSGLPLNQPFYSKDPQIIYNDYDFLFRDPIQCSSFSRSTLPTGSYGPSTKFCEPTDLFYLDQSLSAWSPAAPGFLPLAPMRSRTGVTEVPSASGCGNFSATAALYGHVMRRSVPYRHGNYGDVMAADRLTSSTPADDLWRLFPCRPLSDVFGKRFHPYL